MASQTLALTVDADGHSEELVLEAAHLVCCGWAGRNPRAVEAHVEELAELGVPRPSKVPTYMNFSTHLLTTDADMTVVSDKSSGEVEYVLLCRGREMWVTVGSDQTDREIETTSIPASKQMCAKYLARRCWRYEEIADHWDALLLRCWITHNGTRTLYQDAAVATILAPADLIDGLPNIMFPPEQGLVLFSGTIATLGGLAFGEAYDIALVDPIRGRTIAGSYNVSVLPQYL